LPSDDIIALLGVWESSLWLAGSRKSSQRWSGLSTGPSFFGGFMVIAMFSLASMNR
jgi:hypothetical protein